MKSYLALMPPQSYASMYQNFSQSATLMGGQPLDVDSIESTLRAVIENHDSAAEYDRHIKELDEEQARSKDVEKLVIARSKAEAKITSLNQRVIDTETALSKYELYLRKQMKAFDAATKNSAEGAKVAAKMAIMEEVLGYFSTKLEAAAQEYSQRLQQNIQQLLDEMLTSKRTVSVTSDFAVTVTDSFQDESKSEGQFAIVSFAYIGGILKMLRNDAVLHGKEYPLVLDGPFSKLDPDMRQNVVTALPKFAPQVIIFSKDDLHDVIAADDIGYVWTIQSNEEKNVAEVKEGKLWN